MKAALTISWGAKLPPWAAEITSCYGGLMLTLKAPDGSERYIAIEIDQGNVVARSYRGDEPDAKMTVAADATYISSCAEVGPMGSKVIRYKPDDADIHEGEIPSSMDT